MRSGRIYFEYSISVYNFSVHIFLQSNDEKQVYIVAIMVLWLVQRYFVFEWQKSCIAHAVALENIYIYVVTNKKIAKICNGFKEKTI